MADNVSSASAESNSGSGLGAFLKWAGGIVSAVLIAVLTFWLTRTPAPAPTPPTVPPVGLNGVVANSDTHVLIGSATVAVTLGPNTVQQTTDPLGRYSVVLAPVGQTANMGTVKIAAPGYLEYTNSVALQPGDNYAEIAIDPAPSPVVAAVPAPTPTVAAPQAGAPQATAPTAMKTMAARRVESIPVLKAGIVLKKPPANYVKSSVTAFAGVKKQ
jgi:hypothetical protein